MRISGKRLMYTHSQLMEEYNDLMLRVKLFYMIDESEQILKARSMKVKPTPEEIDKMHNRVLEVLRKDTYDPVKY